MSQKDIVFLSETHANVLSLENIKNFTIFGNPDFPLFQNHGGLAAYVSTKYAQYVNNLRFTKCTISFSISVLPDIFFMGVYVYPHTSLHYNDTDFATVTSEINYWVSKGYHPFIGGDFNSRIGDINVISDKSLKWRYADNTDANVNANRVPFADMCEVLKILPINHCLYGHKQFDGGFTYFKSDKKSQIDYVLTDKVGRQKVSNFKLVTSGWHFSDHLPIDISTQSKYEINSLSILIRSKSLVKPTIPENTNKFLKFYRKEFDFNAAKAILLENAPDIIQQCNTFHSADLIINKLHLEMAETIRTTLTPVRRCIPDGKSEEAMDECDKTFKEYLYEINNNPQNINGIRKLYAVYQNKRNTLNRKLDATTNQRYKSIIDTNDSRKLWSSINWTGDIKNPTASNHPPIEELSEHFSNLYDPIEGDGDIQSLRSDIYIPETDDAITNAEIAEASNQMKKGGYDFSLKALMLLLSTITSVILLLMNTILFNNFPSRLCISLLSAIPKTGNLRLTDNYRGIQMQPLLANLYDRIICNRLIRWAKVSVEQTAFQKGKSTIDQIFILRVIISLIKTNNQTLYIGFYDLSKAFDRVSRYLLLKQLIKLGIGSVIFNSLKSIYSVTKCVLRGFGKLSEVFETHTGIKQGASSSVILFILFLDDIIDNLKKNSLVEPVLRDLHCLLHADDTLLLSTNRIQFTKKCNLLIKMFTDKKMQMNFKKSGYMIINGKKEIDIKCPLRLTSGWLQYKASQTYLGSIFTDTGILKADLSLFLEKKNKEVNVKLASFLNQNEYAPISVKLKVVNACINSALTYGCEAWGSCPLNIIETLQRKALKMVLGIKTNTPNEIVYIESGCAPLKPSIYKKQLKYYRKLKNDCENNPTSSISVVFKHALDSRTTFIRHYKNLDEAFSTPEDCYRFHIKLYEAQTKTNIEAKHNIDADSILGTYKRINPTLQSPLFYKDIKCQEFDRITITKYRVGSHNLKIQSGRLAGEDRRARLCKCGNDIQTIQHVLLNCPLTANIRIINGIRYPSVESFFNGSDYVSMAATLKSIEKLVK